MALRPLTTLRNAATALVLLTAALGVLEFWFRSQTSPTIQILTDRCPVEDQCLLAVSESCHHELKRKSVIRHTSQDGTRVDQFRVNSMGFRGEEPDIPAAEGTYRILVLGDDSVCGTAVGEEETIAARLKQFLVQQTQAQIEVINGGIPGYCPLLSWLKYEQDFAQLKPQLVILHVDMTDVADDADYRCLLSSVENRMVCSHPTLRLPAKPDTSMMHLVKQSSMASWLFAATRQHGSQLSSDERASAATRHRLAWISDDPPDLRLQVRHALSPIESLKNAVEKSGGHLLVTTAPTLWQVVSADQAPELSRRCGITGVTPFVSRFPFEVLHRYCEHAQIRFCDATPVFSEGENREKLFSRQAPVLSRLGNALYAREIARYLITNPPAKW
jgi:hypothetical protein